MVRHPGAILAPSQARGARLYALGAAALREAGGGVSEVPALTPFAGR